MSPKLWTGDSVFNNWKFAKELRFEFYSLRDFGGLFVSLWQMKTQLTISTRLISFQSDSIATFNAKREKTIQVFTEKFISKLRDRWELWIEITESLKSFPETDKNHHEAC